MKKTLITLCAFVVLFGFAVSGAMAQATWQIWEFTTTTTPTPIITDLRVPEGEGLPEGLASNWEPITLSTQFTDSPVADFTDLDLTEGVDDSYIGPNGVEYVIDENTVGYKLPACQPGGSLAEPIAFAVQPIVPEEGVFAQIAVGENGRVYILFNGLSKQYILVGTSLFADASVTFTPRSLNQSSQGKWVTCKISGLPDGYTPADIILENLCIVSVNGQTLAEPIPPSSDGPFNNRNKKKLIIKFSREDLISAIPDETGNVDVTVVGTLGPDALPFFGTDTFKTKYKEKKNHKPK